MILDHRTYTCHPGRINKHQKLYADHGWETQRRNLGEPIVYAAVETGDVNSYIHIWVYKDHADRDARRAALAADPEWHKFMKLSAESGNLLSQVNKILKPAPFFEKPTKN